MKEQYTRLNINNLSFKVNEGDMLYSHITEDRLVKISNVQKVLCIEEDGNIILECINPLCTNKCVHTFTEEEKKTIKIANEYKKSGRLSLVMFG